jgi:hypothetical protein
LIHVVVECSELGIVPPQTVTEAGTKTIMNTIDRSIGIPSHVKSAKLRAWLRSNRHRPTCNGRVRDLVEIHLE